MTTHDCNPRTWETEAGGLKSSSLGSVMKVQKKKKKTVLYILILGTMNSPELATSLRAE